ncbi:MAG: site-specific integrase [Clostridiales bacterium]|nr:site-specific integrase [Clostridiales bacterium]
MDSLTKQKSLDTMADELISFLEQIGFHPYNIRNYRRHIERIRHFMSKQDLLKYTANECDIFIRHIIGSAEYKNLSRNDKDAIRCANILIEYQLTGMISYRIKEGQELLHGSIGNDIQSYLDYRKSIEISLSTLYDTRLYLGRFQKYLDSVGRKNLVELTQRDILGFIKSISYSTKATIHCTLCTLRGFLRYLNSEGILAIDWSYLVPKDSYKKEAKLPTTYTKEEVDRMLKAVDRGNPKGKRDYAMMLLAARLGLRSSDICGLTFENLLWSQNLIVLIQEKTKKRIELPLLTEVGNAIIDYLKYGRPESDLPHVFLHANHGYRKLQEPTLHSIVCSYMRLAGIANVDDKKHGPHALRHSLAGFLLEKHTPLPVISEVLGHASTESTKTYIRIDMNSLRQCALEVSFVSDSYYRKGGFCNG